MSSANLAIGTSPLNEKHDESKLWTSSLKKVQPSHGFIAGSDGGVRFRCFLGQLIASQLSEMFIVIHRR